MRLLKVLLVLELLVGMIWAFPVVQEERLGGGIALLLACILPFQLLFMLIAAWRGVRQPEARRLAALAFVAPGAWLFLPGILRSLFGAPLLDPSQVGLLIAAPVGLALAYCLLLPRRAAAHLPRFLLASRWLNVGILLLAAGGLLGLAILVASYVEVMPSDSSGIALGLALACMVVAAALALPIVLYSWVGLFQSRETRQRGLRIAQLGFSSIQLLVTLAIVGEIASQ